LSQVSVPGPSGPSCLLFLLMLTVKMLCCYPDMTYCGYVAGTMTGSMQCFSRCTRTRGNTVTLCQPTCRACHRRRGVFLHVHVDENHFIIYLYHIVYFYVSYETVSYCCIEMIKGKSTSLVFISMSNALPFTNILNKKNLFELIPKKVRPFQFAVHFVSDANVIDNM